MVGRLNDWKLANHHFHAGAASGSGSGTAAWNHNWNICVILKNSLWICSLCHPPAAKQERLTKEMPKCPWFFFYSYFTLFEISTLRFRNEMFQKFKFFYIIRMIYSSFYTQIVSTLCCVKYGDEVIHKVNVLCCVDADHTSVLHTKYGANQINGTKFTQNNFGFFSRFRNSWEKKTQKYCNMRWIDLWKLRSNNFKVCLLKWCIHLSFHFSLEVNRICISEEEKWIIFYEIIELDVNVGHYCENSW